jgi:hypothetical protein
MYVNPIPIIRGQPHSELEWQLISDYLKARGYSHQDLLNLPKDEAHRLRIEACQYASLKLAEIESRAKFKHKIRFEG